MIPLLITAGVLVVALVSIALRSTVATRHAERRLHEAQQHIAWLHQRLDEARAEVALAQLAPSPRLGQIAAAVRGQRTKPLPSFIRHAQTCEQGRTTDARI